MKKKLLALLLVIVLIIGLMPVSALANSSDCAHSDAFIKDSTTSDCYYPGVALWKCPTCNSTWTENLPLSEDHNFVNGQCAVCWTPCNCSVVNGKCTICGKVDDTTVPDDYEKGPCGHRFYESYEDANVARDGCYRYISEKAPTCDETGWYGILHCYACGEGGVIYLEYEGELQATTSFDKEEIPANGHNYVEISRTPNCLSDGVVTEQCSVCEDVREQPLAAFGQHTVVDGACLVCGFNEDGESVPSEVVCATCQGATTPVNDVAENLPNLPADNCYYSYTAIYKCDSGNCPLTSVAYEATGDHKWDDGSCKNCNLPCGHTGKLNYEDNENGLSHKVICEICEGTVSEAEAHTFNNGICEHCNAEEPAPGCNHVWKISMNGREPTCDLWGGPDIYWCDGCQQYAVLTFDGDEIVNIVFYDAWEDATIPATGSHSYVLVKEEPNCVTSGHVWYKCETCDAGFDYETEALGEHAYVDGVCVRCGEIEDPCADGHLPEADDDDCTTDIYCDREGCNEVVELGADKHIPVCEQTDCTVAVKCKNCEQDAIPATDHNYTIKVDAVEPTCTEDGHTEYSQCECGAKTLHALLQATGHNYVDGKCECGAEDPDYVAPSVPSTPIKPAYPNWGNIFDNWFGNWWDKDEEVCDHDYEAVVTAPTCTEEGYTTHTCSKCGDSYKDSYVDALDHDYVDGKCECGAEDPDYVAPSVPGTPVKPAQPSYNWIIKAILKWWK